jgi:transposase
MTLNPRDFEAIPEETVRVARAAFPKGNAYIKLRDELNTLYKDEDFADLFPRVGQFAESPGRLALITVLQFVEGLSDRQAADAVRSRIDWKYFLGLELDDPGFDYSVLSEFRGRLLTGEAAGRLLDKLLEAFKKHKLIKERSRQRTDSTHIQVAVRQLNRLEKVGETLRAALNELAKVAPEWLKERVPIEWYERYGVRFEAYRLPKEETRQQELATQIGEDGKQLLNWVYEQGTAEIREEKSIRILWRVWLQEYYLEGENTSWRNPDNTPPSELKIDSPYDPEARYSEKRGEGWVGYKVHLTETCDDNFPHVIVHVETSIAPQPDYEVIPGIHQSLSKKNLLPSEHTIDQGYMNIRHVVAAESLYGIEVVGYPMPDSSWQAKANQGFDTSSFVIDWEQRIATCPMQQTSQRLVESKDSQGKLVFRFGFPAKKCLPCPQRINCTHSKAGGRKLTIRPQSEFEALARLRVYLHTEEFKAKYRRRAGVEGTISQGVRSHGLRRTRYIGLAKVHLQHIATAAAINMARIFNWLLQLPIAQTRSSRFSSLAVAPL